MVYLIPEFYNNSIYRYRDFKGGFKSPLSVTGTPKKPSLNRVKSKTKILESCVLSVEDSFGWYRGFKAEISAGITRA